MYQDYGAGCRHPRESLEGYLATGSAGSVASGRVAYALGLRARRSPSTPPAPPRWSRCTWPPRRCAAGECTLALAGGVTVLATPALFIEFSRQRGLAPDGRCKSFAEAADGAGFSEGVGVLRAGAPLRRAAQRPRGPGA